MKKVFIINFLFFFTIVNICNSQLLKDYTGEIVITYPNIGLKNLKDFKDGILIYSPKNNKSIYVAKGAGFSDVSFSENKERILGLSNEHTVVEYDIKTKDIITVFTDENEDASYEYVKYVPKTDYISFIAYPNFYILNRKTKEKIMITQLQGEYSWSNDGKKLFYSNGGKIYYLDMASKKRSLYINNGFEPQLSVSNKYIVFQSLKNELILKEIKTGKEWYYKAPRLHYYKFSPDDKYLAIIEEVPAKKYFSDIDLIAWDFKNNKKTKLIGDIYNGSCTNFDWK